MPQDREEVVACRCQKCGRHRADLEVGKVLYDAHSKLYLCHDCWAAIDPWKRPPWRPLES